MAGQQMPSEIWKPVLGWEDAYEVSNLGRVRSVDRVAMRKDGKPLKVKGRILLAKPNGRGYPRVTLNRGGESGWALVHRLVADAFLDAPDGEIGCLRGQFVINHKDGNKINNAVSNLEWVTTSENYHHAKRTGLLSHIGTANGRSKLTGEQVTEIREKYIAGARQVDLAAEYGVDQTSISRIVRGVGYADVA